MGFQLLQWGSGQIVHIISELGYAGIGLLMTAESSNIFPIPAEMIMPFFGFLVSKAQFSFWGVVVWVTLGNIGGGILAYLLSLYGGRPLIKKYGKYVLLSEKDLDRAHHWFTNYGQITVFLGRLIPMVRTLVSIPAGIGRMPFFKFTIFTGLGSLVWSLAFTYTGVWTGENWTKIQFLLHRLDWLVLGLISLGLIWIGYKRLPKTKFFGKMK